MSEIVETERPDPWKNDLLGYRKIGAAFTNLVGSVEDSKVISIEAGFGRGKTFFRKAWAKELSQAGEVVIEIDAQLSDHSGDPVVTFLGALMEALPTKERSAFLKAWSTGKRLAWGGVKLGATIVARKVGEELAEGVESWANADGETSTLDEMLTEFSKGVSKAMSAQVAAQLSAERVRKTEMPVQLQALRAALTTDPENERVVIIVDELDRCHPDYAIALLEAMKMVFDQPGFVFVLMVNAEYLQSLAHHRFGTYGEGEQYLEKFVDLRLALDASSAATGEAASILALQLPLAIPFGD